MQTKLNTKRTFLIGFAFFTILMLWQVYYYYCPLYLKELMVNHFGPGNYNYIIGIVMAVDNIFAMFMIPLFGYLSDKTKTKFGRRMPYIVAGAAVSLVLFPFIAFMFVINSLAGLCIMMGLLIVSMGIYRSPAVALMPDVTPKPQRASANAIINFVGYIGAIIGSGLTMVFTMSKPNLTIMPFIITSVFMLAALIILVIRFKENKIVEETKAALEEGEKQSETLSVIKEDQPLGKRDKVNLFILIGSIFLWYFAFEAMQNFGSLYGTEILKTQRWGLATTVLAIASLVTFLPSVQLTKKIGRKNSTVVGLALMMGALLAAAFVKTFGIVLILLFAVAGAGWALINVNSYPMLVEMASQKNVGRYTGIYYTATQTAQCITSVVVGFVFDWLGLKTYFYYAALFMGIALLLFMFFKTQKKPAEAKADQK